MEMPEGYEVIVAPCPQGLPLGSSWIVRVYERETGQHVHSAEGGVALSVGLREAERAIRDDQMERLAETPALEEKPS
jgi:hypothetical protein